MIKLIISSLVIMILCIVKNISFNLFSVKPNVDIKFYWLPRTATNLIMWYNKPSSQIPLKNITNMRFYFNLTKDNLIWQQNTLPIGNGYLGANIFGEIITERVSFNEKSLWSGGPCHKRPKYNGGNLLEIGRKGKLVKEIQQYFKEGDNEKAKEKCITLTGDTDRKAFGTYQSFGEFQFHFLDTKEERVFNYIRYLDLDNSLSYVKYDYSQEDGEISTIQREYFASYPDNVICIKFSQESKTSKMTIESQFISSHESKNIVVDDEITNEGQLEDNEMKFNGKMKVISKDGKIQKKENSLLIKDATEVVFIITAATDYKNSYPRYRTGETSEELNSRVQKVIDKAVEKGYEKIKEDHLNDYQKIFKRVEIDIDQKQAPLPTNELLEAYKHNNYNDECYNKQFRYLEILLFQYGRYLDISSSRQGSLPPNLQGVWNDQNDDVPWAGDYHININLQMNYFPTYITNMAYECGPPLLDFIESLQVPGRLTAAFYTGVFSDKEEKNGFMAHTRLNPFGYTAPGWKFNWGWSPTAILWILHNVFELFLFTNDIELLRTRIYPLLKEEALYFEKLFIKDEKNNRVITSPTFSPEHGPPTNGNTYEQTIVWQHFTNTLMSAKLLNVDSEHIERWEKLLNSFKPIEIGESGQIKEWYEETFLGSMGERGHRHLSHLLGLYPFDLINVDTPEWLKAAKVSMNDRGDNTTGWGMGQRINAWARTGDGNRSLKLIHELLQNGIYSNLWDTHPPFQIDGNFAATSGIAEMLLQSTYNHLNILPALPDLWKKKGSFKGLVGKGNIVVSCNWENGKAKEIILETKFENEIEIRCEGIEKSSIIEKENGRQIEPKISGTNKIVFKSRANSIYMIKLNDN